MERSLAEVEAIVRDKICRVCADRTAHVRRQQVCLSRGHCAQVARGMDQQELDRSQAVGTGLTIGECGEYVIDAIQAPGIGLDHRIGPKCLSAGPGYGGSCFPKDLLALLKAGLDFGVPIRSIETIISINDQRKRAMARRIIAVCGGSMTNLKEFLLVTMVPLFRQTTLAIVHADRSRPLARHRPP